MKKPKRVRRKARFWVGQVVVAMDDWLAKIVHNHGLTNLGNHLEQEEYQYELDIGMGYLESELRPLTAKEIGPRRERGQ